MKKSRLIEDLIDAGAKNSATVKDARVGISWTAVHGKYCGLAKTYGVPVKHGNYTRNMGHLNRLTTLELAEYAHSWNLVEASLGCAAISSMIAPPANSTDINAQTMIMEKGAGANVVIVGAFPFTNRLMGIAKQACVLELDPFQLDPRQGILPDSAAEYVIPDCDLLIMTGSTLINKSMERLLALARSSHAYTIILGPSTIMSEVLFDYGAHMLAGAFVTHPEAVIGKLTQSGGMLNGKVCAGEMIFKVMQR
ncbi:DUF364 domain-containing protein [Desulfosarcina cetonica]